MQAANRRHPGLGPRDALVIAALGGLLVAGLTLVVSLGFTGGGGTATTSAPPAAGDTLETTTTTEPDTDTAGLVDASLYPKTAPAQGTPTGRLTAIRSAQHESYTRLVFDFTEGGTPGYWIGYTDPMHLKITVSPVDGSTPFDTSVFDSSGSLELPGSSAVNVSSGGPAVGGTAWNYIVETASQTPFSVGTLEGPPRIYIDLAS